jgi:hypothetical protein
MKDLWTGGRKLNIVPLALTQRPQELNYAIRQLCNLSLYGQFSSQDISYIDKECLAPYRKQGLKIDATPLISLKVSEFLIIQHGVAAYDLRTVKRITPHGADTPSLTFIPPISDKTKKTVGDLGEKLKALLEAEQAKESELENLKRKNRALEEKVEDLERKTKLGEDFRELLKGGNTDSKEMIKELQIKHDLQAKGFETQIKEKQTLFDASKEAYDGLSKKFIELQKRFDVFSRIGDAIEYSVKVKFEEFAKTASMIPLPNLGETTLTVDKNEAQIYVDVNVENVTANDSTLRGQLAILASEGILDQPRSIKSIAESLRALGYSAPSKGLTDELTWFVQKRILLRQSDGYYKVKNKKRIIVRERGPSA